MCQRKPGPRCTAHAKAQVRAAMEGVKTLPSDADKSTVQEAKMRLTKATFDYDSTPGGQTALKKEIERLNEEVQQSTDFWETRELQKKLGRYRIRLMRGGEVREYQTELLRQLEEREKSSTRKRSKKVTLASRWRESDRVKVIACSDGDELHVFQSTGYGSRDYEKYAWRMRGGKPIAMIHFYDSTHVKRYSDGKGGYEEINTAVLCSIEVKPENRGSGLGLDTVKYLNAEYGQLHTSGSFSSSGYKALSDSVPLYKGAELHEESFTLNYHFVDWDKGDLAH